MSTLSVWGEKGTYIAGIIYSKLFKISKKITQLNFLAKEFTHKNA